MTVCIAARVLGTHIVTICDRKVTMSAAGFSADHVMEKADPVHPSWIAMVSGEDVTPAEPIWDGVRERLGFTFSKKRPEEKSLREVSKAFEDSFREFRRAQIIGLYLEDYKLTPESFLERGKKLLGLSLFTETWNKINQFTVKCGFLVAGFDRDGEPHIFGIEDPGICTSYDSLGFWATGTGQPQALSSIFFAFKYIDPSPSFEGLMYDLCAAKFMAESAEGVGEATNVLVMEFQKEPSFYSDESIQNVRAMWDSKGRPRRPKDVESRMSMLPLIPLEYKWE